MTLVGAPLERTRAQRVRPPLLAAGAVLALSLALHVRDPHQQGSWGICPTKALTGWDCPGCGGLRAVNDLTDGHVVAALSSNALFVLALPLVAVLWVLAVRRAWRGLPNPLSARQLTRLTWVYVGVALAFAVVRNTPWGHWLHS